MVYPALLPVMRTPGLPVVDWTDAPVDLNGLVRFAERRNLVSRRVPSHLKRSVLWSTQENEIMFGSGTEGGFGLLDVWGSVTDVMEIGNQSAEVQLCIVHASEL